MSDGSGPPSSLQAFSAEDLQGALPDTFAWSPPSSPTSFLPPTSSSLENIVDGDVGSFQGLEAAATSAPSGGATTTTSSLVFPGQYVSTAATTTTAAAAVVSATNLSAPVTTVHHHGGGTEVVTSTAQSASRSVIHV